MENFLSKFISSLKPYTAGEQPQDKAYIKLNTNENPYPPSPKAAEALRSFDIRKLPLYPSPNADVLLRSDRKSGRGGKKQRLLRQRQRRSARALYARLFR